MQFRIVKETTAQVGSPQVQILYIPQAKAWFWPFWMNQYYDDHGGRCRVDYPIEEEAFAFIKRYMANYRIFRCTQVTLLIKT